MSTMSSLASLKVGPLKILAVMQSQVAAQLQQQKRIQRVLTHLQLEWTL